MNSHERPQDPPIDGSVENRDKYHANDGVNIRQNH